MAHVGSRACPLLIGRDDLLDLADRRLDEVVAGRGHFLLVAGEAGIGKTRFLDAVTQKAEERGFAVDRGYLAPQDRDVPAASILDMARTMLRIAASSRRLGATCWPAGRDDRGRIGPIAASWSMDVVDRILAELSTARPCSASRISSGPTSSASRSSRSWLAGRGTGSSCVRRGIAPTRRCPAPPCGTGGHACSRSGSPRRCASRRCPRTRPRW